RGQMNDEERRLAERVVDRRKARKYFSEVLPQIVTAIVDADARAAFSEKDKVWLDSFVKSAFSLRQGVIYGANLAQVIKLAQGFYNLNQIILVSDVELQFDASLLGNVHLQGIAACFTNTRTTNGRKTSTKPSRHASGSQPLAPPCLYRAESNRRLYPRLR
ncbi:MAG TPA: hypothetical protein VM581_04060, partial [Magnetospirillaceae bacterium]|nr:hypothetical protein [Magnetospirillaceae bacterium]